MILLECLRGMDENATQPFPLLEPSLTPSRIPKPNVRKTSFSKQNIFVLENLIPSFGKYIGLPVDPTRFTDRRDSLLNGRKNVKRKCGLIFEFWKIRPQGRTVLLWSRHLLLFLFLNGENQVRTKNPNDSSMEKKRSAKTRFLGPGIRLPIGKVPHMR